MVPAKKVSSQNWLPEFFNDFFDGNIMQKIGIGGPAMNIWEDDSNYKIEIAAPGMCKKDVDIHVTKDNKLIIEMERRCEDKEEEKKECKEKECKNKKYLRREFSCTKLHQTLALPEIADKDNIEATVKHGVLHIIIPKLSVEQIKSENKVIEVK
ncbi:MAG: Hsp20/alpha crystallin family protein [Bacteroidales bacterium]|nr:Hsp20/alpha crystallin family protein [Bacteroidales bacterium]